MSDSLSITISADTSKLTAQLAIAQAELKQFSAETRTLATSFRAAGDETKASILPQLEAAATSAAKARGTVTQLKATLEGGFGGKGITDIHSALESVNLSTREVTTGAARMGEELARGNIGAAAPHIAMLAVRLAEVNPLLAIGGVAALGFAGAMAEVSVQALKSGEAIRGVADAAAAYGRGAVIGQNEARQLVEGLTSLMGGSIAESAAVTRAFETMRDGTDDQRRALEVLSKAFAKSIGEDPKKMAEDMAKAIDGGAKSIVALVEKYHLWSETASEAQHAAMSSAIGMEEAGARQKATVAAITPLIEMLEQRYTKLARAMANVAKDAPVRGAVSGAEPIITMDATDPGQQKQTGDQAHSAEIIQQATERLDKERALRDQINELMDRRAALESSIAAAAGDALSVAQKQHEFAAVALSITTKQRELSSMVVADLEPALAAEERKAQAAREGSAARIAAYRNELAILERLDQGGSDRAKELQTKITEQLRAASQERIQISRTEAAARLNAERTIAEEQMRLAKSAAEEGKITPAQATQQQLAILDTQHQSAVSTLTAQKGSTGQTPQELAAINGQLSEEDARYAAKRAEIISTGDKQAADQERQLATERTKVALDAQKAILQGEMQKTEEEYRLGNISASQKAEFDRSYAIQELDIQLASLQQEADANQNRIVAHEQTLGQMQQAEIAYANRVAQINTQLAEEQKKTWQEYFGTVTSTLDQIVSGLLRGTERMNVVLLHGAEEAATNFAKTLLNKALKPVEDALENIGSKLLSSAFSGAASGATQAFGGASATAIEQLATATVQQTVETTVSTTSMATLGVSMTTLEAAVVANTAALTASSGGSGIGALGSLAAAVPAFAEGTPHVTRAGLAMIHAGEAVIPSRSASLMRSNIGNGSFGRFAEAAAGGNHFTMGDLHVHPAAGQNLTPSDIAHAVASEARKFSRALRA